MSSSDCRLRAEEARFAVGSDKAGRSILILLMESWIRLFTVHHARPTRANGFSMLFHRKRSSRSHSGSPDRVKLFQSGFKFRSAVRLFSFMGSILQLFLLIYFFFKKERKLEYHCVSMWSHLGVKMVA